jgi:hypothetical protein
MIADFGNNLNQGCYQHKEVGENLFFLLQPYFLQKMEECSPRMDEPASRMK